MSNVNFFERAAAGLGAIALTVTMLATYFATPQVQSVAGILA